MKLQVGDYVRLTGNAWGSRRGKVVRVDEIRLQGMPWSNEYGANSVGTSDMEAFPPGHPFSVEKAEKPAGNPVATIEVSMVGADGTRTVLLTKPLTEADVMGLIPGGSNGAE